MGALRGCFTRTQTWLQAGKYVSALVSELPKRNGWTMAEHAGDRGPDRMQRLLNRASWDALAAMSEIRRFAAAGLETAARRRRRAGLVIAAIDETGQEKAGECTAGVKRQYMGCAGRVANGINTVHVSLVREKTGHALAGARQRIPREQIQDPVTSLVTGLPLDLEFRTKGQLAMDICADCLDQCQARLCTAIQRHIVLVMAALAICAITAAQLKDRTDAQAPPPVTPDQAPPGPA